MDVRQQARRHLVEILELAQGAPRPSPGGECRVLIAQRCPQQTELQLRWFGRVRRPHAKAAVGSVSRCSTCTIRPARR